MMKFSFCSVIHKKYIIYHKKLNLIQARRYGVRAAMPGFIARKLCPELIFVPTDFKKYTYYSGLTREGSYHLPCFQDQFWIINLSFVY